MKAAYLLAGVLLYAAPLFSQQTATLPASADPTVLKGELKWFSLTENRTEVAKEMGLPVMAAPVGPELEAWQFQLGPTEEEGFSHQFVFSKATGTLVSVTRNYEPEREVDSFFPAAETKAYFYPNAAKPEYRVRVRRLSGARLLIAMGVSKPGESTGQILLIRETELIRFYPWLAAQLK